MLVGKPRVGPTELFAPPIGFAFSRLKMSIWNVNTLLLRRMFFFTLISSWFHRS